MRSSSFLLASLFKLLGPGVGVGERKQKEGETRHVQQEIVLPAPGAMRLQTRSTKQNGCPHVQLRAGELKARVN